MKNQQLMTTLHTIGAAGTIQGLAMIDPLILTDLFKSILQVIVAGVGVWNIIKQSRKK